MSNRVYTPHSNYYPPTVIERDGNQERGYDIYSRLLKDRIVFIGTPIDDFVANSVVAQLLFLQMQDPKRDINLYINSPGGSVTSMGAVLLAAGTQGKRYALPNSDIMIHQVSGGAQGTASDVERTVEWMFKIKRRLIHILSAHTGKSDEQVQIDSDRDYWMSADEAKAYGLVDEVVKSRKDVRADLLPQNTGSVVPS